MSFSPSNFPADWYWISQDGKRVFASARCAVVGPDDAGLAAFKAAEFTPSRWPTDGDSADSDAEMDAVLRLYGLSLAGRIRLAFGDDLQTVLTDAEIAAMGGASPRDQRMLSAQRVPFAPTDGIIVRLAAAMKIDPVAWFARLPG